jgi:Calcium binding
MRDSGGKPSPERQGGRASERGRRKPTKEELRHLVERATVDCYNESEQVTGLYTMIEEYLAVPFQTSVLGVVVTVEMVDLTDAEEIVVVCRREGVGQRIAILDLALPDPSPDGWEWIEAYRYWARG